MTESSDDALSNGHVPFPESLEIPDPIREEMAIDPDDADIATVSTLSSEFEKLLELGDFLHHDYVLGDVTGVGSDSKDNLYFTLQDGDTQLSCIVFADRRETLTTEPDDEARMLVRGDLDYHARGGHPSLQVTECHRVGEGAYTAIYERIEAELAEDGLFDDERKQPLPTLPHRIGLVTSAHGDAVTDACEAIHTRCGTLDVVVEHATVQGDDAVKNVVTSVESLDNDPSVDLIVVTRGGGADATLRTFNERAVCRTVARTDTPIAVGIGHENDETLAGRVADERIMTPTDAGRLVPDREAWLDRVATLRERLGTAVETTATDRLTNLQERVDTAYDRLAEPRLTGLAVDLDQAAAHTAREELQALDTRLETAATRLGETRLRAYDAQLTSGANTHSRERLRTLDADLEYAYESLQREKEREAELAETKRKYTAVILVLLLVLLGVVIGIFVL